jgi:hypothetical protein
MTGAAAGAAAGQGHGGGAAAAGDGDGAAQQADAQGAQQTTDVAALAEQLGTNVESVEQLRAFIAQGLSDAPPDADEEPTGETEEPHEFDFDGLGELDDLSFLDSGEFGDDATETAQQLAQLVDSFTGERVAEAVAPLREQLAEHQRELQANHLVAEFPELGDPEVAEHVVGLAHELAQQMERPDLAGDPRFWRLAYLAGRAADIANEEAGHNDVAAAYLEGGGGGGRPTGGAGGDAFSQMLEGDQQGRKALPFP